MVGAHKPDAVGYDLLEGLSFGRKVSHPIQNVLEDLETFFLLVVA